MIKTLEIHDLMNLNLFEKITRVRTSFLFQYNNVLYFCVPKSMLKKALGENAQNLKRISDKIRRRVRIVPLPRDIKDAEKFIKLVVSPLEFQELEIKDNEIILTGGRNKAAFIGRDKKRLNEMQKITSGLFGKDFKVL